MGGKICKAIKTEAIYTQNKKTKQEINLGGKKIKLETKKQITSYS